MGKHLLVFLIALFLFSSALAGPRPFLALSESENPLFAELLEEFPKEIAQFDQTVEKPEVIRAFESDWFHFVHEGRDLPAKWFTGYSWSASLQQFLQPDFEPSVPFDRSRMEKIKTEFARGQTHSIHEPRTYAVQRVGEKIADALHNHSHRVKVVVYGGFSDTLPAALGVASHELIKLPSTYSKWGLNKVFISGKNFADGVPRYVMQIPPSKQYVIHYAQLFQLLGHDPIVYLNYFDQDRQVHRLQKAFLDLKARLPGTPDVVALGYYPVFEKFLRPTGPSRTFAVGEGLTARWVEDRSQSTPVRYLLLKSDLTIWGESSAFIAEGALELAPKAMLFLGSAGGISSRTSVYDVSIPSRFVLGDRPIPITNEIHSSLAKANLPNVVLGGTHGHTNSPIEQTRAYITGKAEKGIDSLDVEQNLIADVIAKHNRDTGSRILFGAINLITDKPQSLFSTGSSEFDLARINEAQKSLARERAVHSALTALRTSVSFQRSLRAVRCQAVMLALPF